MTEPTLPAGVHCAVLTAAVPCRVCGLVTPLNHLPIAGAIRCLHCGRAQAGDDDVIDELVARAHDIVDLAGDSRGPYAAVGQGEAAHREEFGKGWAMVGPGGPRCELCRGALSIACGQRGSVSSSCAACGDQAEYRLDPPHHHAGFLGVLSSEHRVGRLSAGLSGEGAALLLTCPKCGAPLEPESGSHVVKCTFCQAQSFITEEALAMAKGPVTSEPFYLFFAGASNLRREIDAELERAERRRQSDERFQKALADQRSLPDQQQDGGAGAFVRRHIGSIAGFSTLFGSMASFALVFAVLQDRYLEDPAWPALVTWGVYVAIGLSLQGKGKIASMPTRTAHRVLLASTASFLVVVAVCFVLFVRTP